jgi:hypothetical protein
MIILHKAAPIIYWTTARAKNPLPVISWLDDEEDGSIIFENAKAGDFILDENFQSQKYALEGVAAVAVNDELLEIADGSSVLFHVFKDGGARVFGIEDKITNKTFFWADDIGWYKTNSGEEFDNWWAYDILNAGTNVVRPLVMLAGGDPQGCSKLKTAYSNYNGSGGIAGFVAKQAVDGVVQLFSDIKAGGHKRSQALLTIWYTPMSVPATGLAAKMVGVLSKKLINTGIKLGGKTLQRWAFVTALNVEIFAFNVQSLDYTFKNGFYKSSAKKVLYTIENIRYNTDINPAITNGSIELVQDATGTIGWRKAVAQAGRQFSLLGEEALGGHSIARHGPQLTLLEMEQRVLGTHPTIPQSRSALRFETQVIHEDAVNKAFTQYGDEIDVFFANPNNTYKEWTFDYGSKVGSGYTNTGTLNNPVSLAVTSNKVTISIKRVANSPRGYRLESAFPDIR